MAVDFKVRESIASKVTGTVSHSNVQERIFDVSRTPARDTIAVLRAVVCLSILCMHFFPAALAQWPGSAKQVPDPQWLVANVRFGFESFFVLAGYFLFHSFRADDTSHISVTAFLKRRLLRLAVPYWVALVIVGVCGYILSGLIRGKAPLAQFSDLPPTVFFVHDLIPVGTVSYALWFMAPLMQFYLLWSLIFWMVREYFAKVYSPACHQAALKAMFFLAVGVFACSVLMAASQIRCDWKLAQNAHYLILGGVSYYACMHVTSRWWLFSAITSEVVLGCWLESSRPVAAALMALIIHALAGREFVAGRSLCWLKYIGLRSYSIYLT
jgi:peptidoglycan/LPS O-acetylase OafA/YrhL